VLQDDHAHVHQTFLTALEHFLDRVNGEEFLKHFQVAEKTFEVDHFIQFQVYGDIVAIEQENLLHDFEEMQPIDNHLGLFERLGGNL
jgi:hypothetical protein